MPKRPQSGATRAGRVYSAVMRSLPTLYIGWAILVGSVIAQVTPPWQNADEAAHVRRAVQIGHGELLARRLDALQAGGFCDDGVTVSEAAVADLIGHAAVRVGVAALRQAAAVRWGRPCVCSFANTATYPPFLYAAPALAALIGRTGHMHVAATLLLMRVLNVILAAVIGAAALAAAQRTRLVLAFALLLPMNAALGASAGQDALLLPLAAWAVARIDLARQDPARRPGAAMVLAIGVALLLVGLARPPYAALALLLLALPAVPLWGRVGLVAVVGALTVAWSGYVAWRIGVPLSPADPARQAAFLLHHPGAFAAAMTNTIVQWGSNYPPQAVGVLGWLDTPLPGHFVRAVLRGLVLVMLSAAVADAAQRCPWGYRRMAIGWLAGAGSTMALFLALYVIWSPPGAPFVYGIQGRYFLPLLPALALGMPDLGRWATVLRPPALLCVLLLGAVGPVVTVTTLVDRYYLQP